MPLKSHTVEIKFAKGQDKDVGNTTGHFHTCGRGNKTSKTTGKVV